MLRKLISLILLFTFTFSLSQSAVANIKYNQYNNQKFKEYLDRAREAKDEAAYNRIVETGKNIVEAAWERAFDVVLKRDGEVKEDKETEQKKLEEELNSTIAKHKKMWQVRNIARGLLKEEAGEKQKEFKGELKENVDQYVKEYLYGYKQGKRDARVKDEFNQYMSSEALANKEVTFIHLIKVLDTKVKDLLKSLNVNLTGYDETTDLASFEGLDEGYQQELKSIYVEWDISLRNDIIKAKNRFLIRTTQDVDSLKNRSDHRSADKIIKNVMNETETDLKKVEEKIFDYSKDKDGKPIVNNDFIQNFEAQLAKGVKLWDDAREKLVATYEARMKEGIKYYEEGQEEWKNAYYELIKKRNEWISSVKSQIDQGKKLWEDKTEELNENYDAMQDKLSGYLNDQAASWESYSKSVYNSLFSANGMVSEMEKNIEYLTEAIEAKKKLVTEELNGLSGEIKGEKNIGSKKNFRIMRYESDMAKNIFNQKIDSAVRAELGRRVKSWLDDKENKYNANKAAVQKYYDKKMYNSADVFGSNGAFTIVAGNAVFPGIIINLSHMLPAMHINNNMYLEPTADYTGVNAQEAATAQYFKNRYEVKHTGEYINYGGKHEVLESWEGMQTVGNNISFDENGNVAISLTAKQKSMYLVARAGDGGNQTNRDLYGVKERTATFAYTGQEAIDFFNTYDQDSIARWLEQINTYTTQLVQAKQVQQEMMSAFVNLENMYYDEGLMGVDKNGVENDGILNKEGSSDLYMMSDSEFTYEQTKKMYQYWLKQLYIKQGVYDYAANETSTRLTETELKNNVNKAEKKLNDLNEIYNNYMGSNEEYADVTLKDYDEETVEAEYSSLISKEAVLALKTAGIEKNDGESEEDFQTRKAELLAETDTNYGTLKGLREVIALYSNSINKKVNAIEEAKAKYQTAFEKLMLVQNQGLKEGLKKEGFEGYSGYVNSLKKYYQTLVNLEGNKSSQQIEGLDFLFNSETGVFENYRTHQVMMDDFSNLVGSDENESLTFANLSFLDMNSVDENKTEKTERLIAYLSTYQKSVVVSQAANYKSIYEKNFKTDENGLADFLKISYESLNGEDKALFHELIDFKGTELTEFKKADFNFLSLNNQDAYTKTKKLIQLLGGISINANAADTLSVLYTYENNLMLSPIYQVYNQMKATKDHYKAISTFAMNQFTGDEGIVESSMQDYLLNQLQLNTDDEINSLAAQITLKSSAVLTELEESANTFLSSLVEIEVEGESRALSSEEQNLINDIKTKLSAQKLFTAEKISTYAALACIEGGLSISDEFLSALNDALILDKKVAYNYTEISLKIQDAATHKEYNQFGIDSFVADNLSALGDKDGLDLTGDLFSSYEHFNSVLGLNENRKLLLESDLTNQVAGFNSIIAQFNTTDNSLNAEAIAGSKQLIEKVISGEIALSGDVTHLFSNTVINLSLYAKTDGSLEGWEHKNLITTKEVKTNLEKELEYEGVLLSLDKSVKKEELAQYLKKVLEQDLAEEDKKELTYYETFLTENTDFKSKADAILDAVDKKEELALKVQLFSNIEKIKTKIMIADLAAEVEIDTNAATDNYLSPVVQVLQDWKDAELKAAQDKLETQTEKDKIVKDYQLYQVPINEQGYAKVNDYVKNVTEIEADTEEAGFKTQINQAALGKLSWLVESLNGILSTTQAKNDEAKESVKALINSVVKTEDGKTQYVDSAVNNLNGFKNTSEVKVVDGFLQVSSGVTGTSSDGHAWFINNTLKLESNELSQKVNDIEEIEGLISEKGIAAIKAINKYITINNLLDENGNPISDSVNELTTEVNTQITAINTLETELSGLETKMAGLNNSLANVHTGYLNLLSNINTVKKQIDETKTEYDRNYATAEYAATSYLYAEAHLNKDKTDENELVDAKEDYEKTLEMFNEVQEKFNQSRSELGLSSNFAYDLKQMYNTVVVDIDLKKESDLAAIQNQLNSKFGASNVTKVDGKNQFAVQLDTQNANNIKQLNYQYNRQLYALNADASFKTLDSKVLFTTQEKSFTSLKEELGLNTEDNQAWREEYVNNKVEELITDAAFAQDWADYEAAVRAAKDVHNLNQAVNERLSDLLQTREQKEAELEVYLQKFFNMGAAGLKEVLTKPLYEELMNEIKDGNLSFEHFLGETQNYVNIQIEELKQLKDDPNLDIEINRRLAGSFNSAGYMTKLNAANKADTAKNTAISNVRTSLQGNRSQVLVDEAINMYQKFNYSQSKIEKELAFLAMAYGSSNGNEEVKLKYEQMNSMYLQVKSYIKEINTQQKEVKKINDSFGNDGLSFYQLQNIKAIVQGKAVDNRVKFIYTKDANEVHTHSKNSLQTNDTLKRVLDKLSEQGRSNNNSAIQNVDFVSRYLNVLHAYGDAITKDGYVEGFLTKYKSMFGENINNSGSWRYNQYFNIQSRKYDANPWYKSAKMRLEVRLGPINTNYKGELGLHHAKVGGNDRYYSGKGTFTQYLGSDGKIKEAYSTLFEANQGLSTEADFNLELEEDADISSNDTLTHLKEKLASFLDEYENYDSAEDIITGLNLSNADDKELLVTALNHPDFNIFLSLTRKDGLITNSTISRDKLLSAVCFIIDKKVKLLNAKMYQTLDTKKTEELAKKEKGESYVAHYDTSLLMRKQLALLKEVAWGNNNEQLTSVKLANANTTITFSHRGSQTYAALTDELINQSGNHAFSVMMQQQEALTQLEMDLQIEEYNQDQTQWNMKVNAIFARGLAQWDKGLEDFKAKWQKWQNDTLAEIETLENFVDMKITNFDNSYTKWMKKANENVAEGLTVEMPQAMIESVVGNFNSVMNKASFNSDELKANINSWKNTALSTFSGLTALPSFMVNKASFTNTAFSFNVAKKGSFINYQKENFSNQMNDFKKQMAKINNIKIIEQLEQMIRDSRKAIQEQDLSNYEQAAPGIVNSFGFMWNNNFRYERKVVKDVSLVGGTEYHTQTIDAYDRFKVADVDVSLKGALGQDLTIEKILSMDDKQMDVVFNTSITKMKSEITKIEEKFATHNQKELGNTGRIIKAINRLEKERLEAEAKQDASFLDMDIIPGIPLGLGTLVKIGSVALAGPLGAGAFDLVNSLSKGENFFKAVGGAALNTAVSYAANADVFGLNSSGVFGHALNKTIMHTTTNFASQMGTRLLTGQKINFDIAMQVFKDAGTQGAFAGVADLAGSGIRALGGGSYGEFQNPASGLGTGNYGMTGQSWFSEFSAKFVERGLNSAGAYAGYQWAGKDLYIDDLVRDGKTRSEAKELAKSRGQQILLDGIKGLAVNSMVDLSVAGLNSAFGTGWDRGSFEKGRSAGFNNLDQNGIAWNRNNKIQGAYDLASRTVFDISATLAGNALIDKYGGSWGLNDDVRLSTRATLLSSHGIADMLGDGRAADNLRNYDDIGVFSIGVAGEGAGTIDNTIGDLNFNVTNIASAVRGFKDADWLNDMRGTSTQNGKSLGDYHYGNNIIATANMMLYSGLKDNIDIVDNLISGDFKAKYSSGGVVDASDNVGLRSNRVGFGKAVGANNTIYLNSAFLSRGIAGGNIDGITKAVYGASVMAHEGKHLLSGDDEALATANEVLTLKSLRSQFGNQMRESSDILAYVDNLDDLESHFDRTLANGNMNKWESGLSKFRDLTGEDAIGSIIKTSLQTLFLALDPNTSNTANNYDQTAIFYDSLMNSYGIAGQVDVDLEQFRILALFYGGKTKAGLILSEMSKNKNFKDQVMQELQAREQVMDKLVEYGGKKKERINYEIGEIGFTENAMKDLGINHKDIYMLMFSMEGNNYFSKISEIKSKLIDSPSQKEETLNLIKNLRENPLYNLVGHTKDQILSVYKERTVSEKMQGMVFDYAFGAALINTVKYGFKGAKYLYQGSKNILAKMKKYNIFKKPNASNSSWLNTNTDDLMGIQHFANKTSGRVPAVRKGSLDVVKGGKYSQSELNVAKSLQKQGYDVTLRPPKGVRSVAGETSDIYIKVGNRRINLDVYTPETNKIGKILSRVANKNNQAQRIIVDLSKTRLKPSHFGSYTNYMNRIKGMLKARGHNMNFENVTFVKF